MTIPSCRRFLVSGTGKASDGGQRRRRYANLRRRAFMIAFHRAHRLPDGRSAIAVSGGKAAWRKRAAAHPGGERGLALELAMKRHYPEEQARPAVLEGLGEVVREEAR